MEIPLIVMCLFFDLVQQFISIFFSSIISSNKVTSFRLADGIPDGRMYSSKRVQANSV